MAAVQSELVTELAARRTECTTLADSGLNDTLALLLWVSEALQDQEKHQLVMQVCVYNPILVYEMHRIS